MIMMSTQIGFIQRQSMFVIDDVLKEVEDIKKLGNSRYIREIQPDMYCDVNICIGCPANMNDQGEPNPTYYCIEKKECMFSLSYF